MAYKNGALYPYLIFLKNNSLVSNKNGLVKKLIK